MFSKNQIVEIQIEEINHLGLGVGRVDGMVFFVRGAVGGDRIRARVIKVNKNYCVGKLEEILQPSPYRLGKPFCKAPEACGGCIWRHVEYEQELLSKKRLVEAEMRKAGLADVVVQDVRTTGVMKGYRNKAQYPFGLLNGHVTVGFYESRTHRVMACDACSLQPDVFSAICRFVCREADDRHWSVYDEQSGRGLLRHLYIREGKVTGQIMVCLVINGNQLPLGKQFAEKLVSAFGEIASVLLNVNKKNTNVVLGDEYRTLWGEPYIEDVLCGKKFRVAPAAFYQVNHDGAELLYGIAREKAALSEGETLLDLYCGIGTIGICLCDADTPLAGVEIVEDAVRCARENALENGMKNAVFTCGDAGAVADFIRDTARRCQGKLTVVVDPPRKGLDGELIALLADMQIEKIVYVSCGPDTLARDCRLFRDKGYDIGTVTPVDMFPRTGHVETVVLMSRDKE